MNLAQLRALLIENAYEPDVDIDRIDVKRKYDEVTGADVMFTDGTVAFLATDNT
jgi:hypothetical protein